MVQNSEWGPPLWRILHTLAERLGRQSSALLATDEARAWIHVLRGVELIMPCPRCRAHFKGWRTTHPFERLLGGDTQASRTWLWSLHEEVNQQRGIPAEGRVAFEELERVYGVALRRREDLQQDIDILMGVLQRATLERQVDGLIVRTWRGKLGVLRGLIGV
jgi:hypothetical protein